MEHVTTFCYREKGGGVIAQRSDGNGEVLL